MKEWFEDWFDTVYYNALYSDRNEDEADRFIELLVEVLHVNKGAKILDVGCGRGRHAVALYELGFDVTGIDLSFKKIASNNSVEKDQLHFYRHDMRHIFRINYFDCVFNFFTSFGYFESHHEEKNVAYSMAANLKWGGHLVIDYLNAAFVKSNLIKEDKIKSGDYEFIIHKHLENDRISKKITVVEKDKCSVFYEKVRMYSLQQMTDLFSPFSLSLTNVYGSYGLEPFDELHSERMILVFSKNKS